MRTPLRAPSGGAKRGTGKTGRAALSGVLAISLAAMMAVIPVPASALPSAPPQPAPAAPPKPVIPSKTQVDAARKAAADKAAQVARIESRLAGAGARLEQLGLESAKADEKYNGAVYRLQQAKAEAAAAAAKAKKAQTTLATQRREIGRFAAASYQGGGDLAKIAPLITAEGPQELLDSAGTARTVSAAMHGSYLRFSATQVVTNLFKVQSEQAVAKVKAAADEAAQAKRAAHAAERAAAAAVVAVAAERTQQIATLAVLRNTSVQVAEQRQRGLEELARQRAAAIAAKKAEELRRKIEARERAERAREAEERRREEARERREEAREERERQRDRDRDRDNRDRDNRDRDERPAPPRKKKPKPDRGDNRGGVSTVVDFALSQLGDMYLWGGTGPDRWDCSGLTQAAWRKAGVYLPHYSAAQYDHTRRISEDELRRGDLIFWTDDGSPSGIFHVAIYLGGGQMVHAPRTGKPVRIDSVYYWEDPDYFGRP